MSFCSRARSPSSAGRASIRLSVRISQRNRGGSAAAGTCAIWLALKATISSRRALADGFGQFGELVVGAEEHAQAVQPVQVVAAACAARCPRG